MPVPILPNRYRHLFFQPKRSVNYQSNPCPPITPAMALATAIIIFKRYSSYSSSCIYLIKVIMQSDHHNVSITITGIMTARSADTAYLLKLNTLKQCTGSAKSYS